MYRLVDTSHNEIHMVAESHYDDLYDPRFSVCYIPGEKVVSNLIYFST